MARSRWGGGGGILGGLLSHLIVEPDRAAEFTNFYAILLPGTPGNIVGIMIGGFIGGLAVRLNLGLPSTGNFFAVGLASAGIIWRIGRLEKLHPLQEEPLK